MVRLRSPQEQRPYRRRDSRPKASGRTERETRRYVLQDDAGLPDRLPRLRSGRVEACPTKAEPCRAKARRYIDAQQAARLRLLAKRRMA